MKKLQLIFKKQKHESLVLDNVAIGKSVRDTRKVMGLSQLQVAQEIGMQPSSLCDLEKGKRDWNLILLGSVTLALEKLSNDHERR